MVGPVLEQPAVEALDILRRATVQDLEVLRHDRRALQDRRRAAHDEELDAGLRERREDCAVPPLIPHAAAS